MRKLIYIIIWCIVSCSKEDNGSSPTDPYKYYKPSVAYYYSNLNGSSFERIRYFYYLRGTLITGAYKKDSSIFIKDSGSLLLKDGSDILEYENDECINERSYHILESIPFGYKVDDPENIMSTCKIGNVENVTDIFRAISIANNRLVLRYSAKGEDGYFMLDVVFLSKE